MLLIAHFFLTIPAYNSIKPGIDCRATSEPAVSCQALSPLTSQAGSVLLSASAMMRCKDEVVHSSGNKRIAAPTRGVWVYEIFLTSCHVQSGMVCHEGIRQQPAAWLLNAGLDL